MADSVPCLEVATEGYRVVDSGPYEQYDKKRPSERVLTYKTPGVHQRQVRRYDPSGKPFLFREFAALDGTEESIASFANKYGFLFGSTMEDRLARVQYNTQGIRPATPGEYHDRGFRDGWEYECEGERIASWMRELRDMKEAYNLWDRLARRDMGGLQKLIKWSEDETTVTYERDYHLDFAVPIRGIGHDRHSELIAKEGAEVPLFDDTYSVITHTGGFGKDNPIKPACVLLQMWVVKRLRGRVTAALLWDSDRRKLILKNVPQSLLGAMWLQLAGYLCSGERVIECKECHQFTTAKRNTKEYCSPKCLMRARRRPNPEES